MARDERPLGVVELAERVATIPGWHIDGGWLCRTFRTDGWPTTMMLVNAIGFIAEAADHHPDLAVSWSRVTVKLVTHSASGITDKDIALARRIDEAALWRPPAGDALRGSPQPLVKPEGSAE